MAVGVRRAALTIINDEIVPSSAAIAGAVTIVARAGQLAVALSPINCAEKKSYA